MAQDIKIPYFKDLDKMLQDKLVEKAIDELLAHRHDDEDIDDAIINGLEAD